MVWLCKDLGLLCEQIEVPCQHAEVARAVLAGECMAQAGASSAMVKGRTAGCTWDVGGEVSAGTPVLQGVRPATSWPDGPAAILRTGTWWPS